MKTTKILVGLALFMGGIVSMEAKPVAENEYGPSPKYQ